MNFKSKLKLLPLALSLIVPAAASAQSSAASYDYVIKVQVNQDNYLWIDVRGRTSQIQAAVRLSMHEANSHSRMTERRLGCKWR
jgi:hypothetical protein